MDGRRFRREKAGDAGGERRRCEGPEVWLVPAGPYEDISCDKSGLVGSMTSDDRRASWLSDKMGHYPREQVVIYTCSRKTTGKKWMVAIGRGQETSRDGRIQVQVIISTAKQVLTLGDMDRISTACRRPGG